MALYSRGFAALKYLLNKLLTFYYLIANVNIFKELHKDGHTIIMVTHDPGVGELAQRQVKLEHGKVKNIIGSNYTN